MPAPTSPTTRRLLTCVLLGVAALAAACTSDSGWFGATDASPPRDLAAPDAAAPLLFVARSDTGRLDVRQGDRSTLELDDAAALTWFTDRPERDAGTTSVTDALRSFGWEQNGDSLGDDPPNGALVAAELGADAVVVELLTATVDGAHVQFTVRVVGPPPDSTDLSDVHLFIDDAAADGATQTPFGLEVLDGGGLVLGRTTDPQGQAHALVLHLPPDAEAAVAAQGRLLAVVSGSTFSVTGDAAAGDWGFSIDPTTTSDSAPIVVLKFTTGALSTLSTNLDAAFDPSQLMDDPTGTMTRLHDLVEFVIARAAAGDADAPFYATLAAQLQDPNWTGVLVFNGSVTNLPAEVQGQPTSPFPSSGLDAIDIGFDVDAVAPGSFSSAFFGTVDLPGSAPGSAPDPSGASLQALFANDTLTSFQMGS